MSSDVSSRRKDWRATRELILETFARLVVDEGIHEVSIQKIADRAGVTHRTVYRHFSSRQDLLDELARWLDERGAEQGQVQVPDSPDDIPSAVALNARLFDQDADLIKALVVATWYANTPADAQIRRTDAIERTVAPLTTHLDPEDARAVVAMIRYLASSRTWLALREEFGLTGEESGPVVAWVIELLLDALRDPANPGPDGA